MRVSLVFWFKSREKIKKTNVRSRKDLWPDEGASLQYGTGWSQVFMRVNDRDAFKNCEYFFSHRLHIRKLEGLNN